MSKSAVQNYAGMLVCSIESSSSFSGNGLLFYKFYEFFLAIKLTDPANTKFKLGSCFDDGHCMRVNMVATAVTAVTESEYCICFTEMFFSLAF
jgi:hypothetical protein